MTKWKGQTNLNFLLFSKLLLTTSNSDFVSIDVLTISTKVFLTWEQGSRSPQCALSGTINSYLGWHLLNWDEKRVLSRTQLKTSFSSLKEKRIKNMRLNCRVFCDEWHFWQMVFRYHAKIERKYEIKALRSIAIWKSNSNLLKFGHIVYCNF